MEKKNRVTTVQNRKGTRSGKQKKKKNKTKKWKKRPLFHFVVVHQGRGEKKKSNRLLESFFFFTFKLLPCAELPLPCAEETHKHMK